MASRKPLPDPKRLDQAQSLEVALDHARRFYARSLAHLAEHRDTAQGDDAATWQLLFERVAHDAVWAVTELHRGPETKYFRQRYISAGVRNQWKEASTRGQCAQSVQHEHVFEARKIKKQLETARSEESFYRALSLAAACVVTNKEHNDLKEKEAEHLNGWDRYVEANIKVWDRVREAWRISLTGDSDAAAGPTPDEANETTQ